MDRACLLWRPDCGQRGSCLLYQNAALSRSMLTTGLAYKALGFTLYAITCVLYKAPPGPACNLAPSRPSRSSATDSPTGVRLQSCV